MKLITEQLSVASKTLYDAAEGRVFLKKVTIVAPGNWEKPTDTDIRLQELNFKGVVTGINFDQLPMQIYHTGKSHDTKRNQSISNVLMEYARYIDSG